MAPSRLFKNMGVKSMTEGRDYQFVDMLFPFVMLSIDCVTVFLKNASMTFIHMKHSELLPELIEDGGD